jgi:hydroxymethylglutaryl-CoA lyase
MNLPQSVRLTEVGPRDGLQNEARNLATADKVRLIRMLASAGIDEMEVTSFVSPKAVPNLADAEEVMEEIRDLDIRRIALVVNDRGYERALAAGANALTFVLSATEGHSWANVNCSRQESIDMLDRMAERAGQDGVEVRLAVSVAFGCPFEGDPGQDAILQLVETMARKGFVRIGLCDTMGVANPRQVYDLTRSVLDRFAGVEFELHLHDTYGRGLANILAGLQAGVSRFDASVGGLGGCPFAPGATGNVSTEDVASMFGGMGIQTGINIAELLEASDFVAAKVDRRLTSNLWQVKQSRCSALPRT